MHRRFASFAFVAAFTALCLSSQACSGQGEGERCSLSDDPGSDGTLGTSDCANGLKCWQVESLGGAAAAYGATDKTVGVCCPYQRSPSDPVSICATSPNPPASNAAPPDSGVGDASATSDGASSEAGDAASAPDSGPGSDSGDAAPE